jgi:hypothetical protein
MLLSGVVLMLVLVLVASWAVLFICTVKCSRGYISARAMAVLVESAPTCGIDRASSAVMSLLEVIVLSQRAAYIDYASVAQTAPIEPSEQLHHRVASVSGHSPKGVPRSLQPRLLNESRLERRGLLACCGKSATVALGIGSPTTLLRDMSHLQCCWRDCACEEQRGVQVRKVGDEGRRQRRVRDVAWRRLAQEASSCCHANNPTELSFWDAD